MEIREFDPKTAKEVLKELLKKKVSLSGFFGISEFKIALFYYAAKDLQHTFDKNPLILVLRQTKNHILGLNFHWIPFKYRIYLIEYILKLNTRHAFLFGNKLNAKLKFTYQQLKPFLRKPPYRNCLHCYIRKRMSPRGVLLGSEYLLDIARIQPGDFFHGRKGVAGHVQPGLIHSVRI